MIATLRELFERYEKVVFKFSNRKNAIVYYTNFLQADSDLDHYMCHRYDKPCYSIPFSCDDEVYVVSADLRCDNA